MNKITALRVQQGKGKPKKVKLFVDGKLVFNLDAAVIFQKRLKPGQQLSEADIASLAQLDAEQRCYDAAARYLSYRPRSEAELIHRLRQRNFAPDIITTTITRLKEQGLVNDLAFAQFWVDNRAAFRPRSKQLTRSELRQKGVSREIIEQVTQNVGESDSAYQVASKKARTLSGCDAGIFRRRLGGYLVRRGFGYEVINQIIDKVWGELGKKGSPQREGC